MIVHVISFAFLMVMASTAILSPVLLYVFGLSDLGWRWEHAAMFAAIIASTDAVAVSAVLKSGAPSVESGRQASVLAHNGLVEGACRVVSCDHGML